jgi:hypothetical protein
MKKSHIILIVACVILLGFSLMKIYQGNVSVSSNQIDQMFMENAERVKQALAICEMDDDQEAFIQKAYNMLNEHRQWQIKNRETFKENPELAQKIDEQWMDGIYQLLLSLKNEPNALRQEKKVGAVDIIASQLTKNSQDTLEGYIKNKMQQDGIVGIN